MTSELSRSDKALKREQHPLPKTAVGIAGLVQETLQAGGWVERIVIQNGEPVQVYRYVDKASLEEEDIDLQSALRKCELHELNIGGTSWEQVAKTLQALTRENLWPVCWVVGPTRARLNEWLPGSDGPYLLGVSVQSDNTLPAETLILAGARNSEAQVRDIVVGFRIAMEEEREEANRQACGSGRHPKERSGRDG